MAGKDIPNEMIKGEKICSAVRPNVHNNQAKKRDQIFGVSASKKWNIREKEKDFPSFSRAWYCSPDPVPQEQGPAPFR